MMIVKCQMDHELPNDPTVVEFFSACIDPLQLYYKIKCTNSYMKYSNLLKIEPFKCLRSLNNWELLLLIVTLNLRDLCRFLSNGFLRQF